jgi:hypothetical protein
MSKDWDTPRPRPPRYTVAPGRIVNRDGRALFQVRTGVACPNWEADAYVATIVHYLNGGTFEDKLAEERQRNLAGRVVSGGSGVQPDPAAAALVSATAVAHELFGDDALERWRGPMPPDGGGGAD